MSDTNLDTVQSVPVIDEALPKKDKKKTRWQKEKIEKFRKERAYYAAIIQRQEEAKAEIKRKQEEEKRLKEEELEAERELQLELEIKRKTKEYFTFDMYSRRIPAPENPYYFGDFISIGKAWVPQGEGKFYIKDELVLEGQFQKGFLDGRGKLCFPDGMIWEGEIRDYKMNGIGVLSTPLLRTEEEDSDEEHEYLSAYRKSLSKLMVSNKTTEYRKRHAIAKDNIIICFQDELIPGLQMEFLGPLSGISAAPFSTNSICKAVILAHVPTPQIKVNPVSKFPYQIRANEKASVEMVDDKKHTWIYKVRFFDDVFPKVREIDLEIYSQFRLLRNLPLIYDLSLFGITTEIKRIDDHRITLPTISPQSPVKNKNYKVSAALLPAFPARSYKERSDNLFEARAAGIGAAQEEEEKERQKQLQKEQWAKLIAERKVAFEANRKKQIEDEQQRLLAEELVRQRQLAQQKKDEQKAFLAATQKAVEEELQSLDSKASSLRTKS